MSARLGTLFPMSFPYISAIIPAFNEEKTIRSVVDVLLSHPLIGEVIVVDDGSTDRTADIVADTGVRVIRLSNNLGKAAAMDVGVAAAASECIFFCDADLIGLTQAAVTKLILPVIAGQCSMYVGLRDRRLWWLNRLLYVFPILGGERVIEKSLWNQVPSQFKKSFQIEIALNFAAKRYADGMRFGLMPGVSQIIKERKYGFVRGFISRLFMMWDVVWVGIKIYLWYVLVHAIADMYHVWFRKWSLK